MKKIAIIVIFFIANKITFSQNDIFFDESPKLLTVQEINNLVAFSKLYGYIRFFHPTDQALKTDWDNFAINGVKRISDAENQTELIAGLDSLFSPIAPLLRIDVKDSLKPVNISDYIKYSKKLKYWMHSGYGSHDIRGLMKLFNLYSSVVVSFKVKKIMSQAHTPDPYKIFIGELINDIYCSFPVVVPANCKGTLPNKKITKIRKNEIKYNAENRSVRLASVIICWNIYQHFYPYWNVTKIDWNNSLLEALKEASKDKDANEFLLTLEKIVADTKDGHGSVYLKGDSNNYSIPISIDYIQNRLIITGCKNCDSLGVKIGDEIKIIDEVDADKVIKEKEKYISSATEQWKLAMTMWNLLLGKLNTKIKITLQDCDGNSYTRIFTRGHYWFEKTRPLKIAKIKDSIFYVNSQPSELFVKYHFWHFKSLDNTAIYCKNSGKKVGLSTLK